MTSALLASVVLFLEFSTYIGDANEYRVARVRTDPSGNTLVSGSRVLSSQTSEIFVMKLDGTGKIVLFATLSGKGSDTVNDMATDATGNIYVAGGTTSPNLPLKNPFQSKPGPGFVVKFSPDATQLLYSSYFPAAVKALAVDTAGNAYLTGTAFSTDFPVTLGQSPTFGVAPASGAFVTKISSAGDRILYSAVVVGHGKNCGAGSSCFTSQRSTGGVAIAVDNSGSAYIAGNTDTNDVATPGAMVTQGTGAFVAKVNASGTALAYITYIGPTYYPFVPFTNPANTARAIAADSDGNAYVAGSTFDPLFPATKGAWQPGFNGPPVATSPPDAFVLKLNPGGTAALWGTYLGGKGADVANSLAIDSSGNAWVSGTTDSPDFPNAQGWSAGGDFVAGIDSKGSSLPYSARLPDGTASQSVAVGPAGLLQVAGPTGLISTIAPSQTPTPRIFGIANAANGPATGRIVPGEVAAVYGPHIGASGVRVSVGGINAPVLYSSDSQINVVVPSGIEGRSTAAVKIGTGPDFPAGVSSADPQIFHDPSGYAAAINQDGTVNSPAHPARNGSVVAIWATGTGYESSLDGREGQVATGATDLDCCQVTVFGTPADVLYGGPAPGLVTGVMQINFRVPELEFFAAQPNLEITLRAGGVSSLPVRIYAVQ